MAYTLHLSCGSGFAFDSASGTLICNATGPNSVIWALSVVPYLTQTDLLSCFLLLLVFGRLLGALGRLVIFFSNNRENALMAPLPDVLSFFVLLVGLGAWWILFR